MKIENSKKKSLENSNESASAIDLSKAAWKDHKRPPCTISENYKKIITNFFLKSDSVILKSLMFFQEKYLVAVLSDFKVGISFLDHCVFYRKSCNKLHGKTNCCLSKLIVLHQKWLKNVLHLLGWDLSIY